MNARATLNCVLLVDDEPEILEIAEAALVLTKQLTVHTCASASEALKVVENVTPDLVVLDAMMPGMDGPATLELLRSNERLAHVPYAFMTADTSAQSNARYQQMGIAGIIPKPFDPMSLGEQVLTIWERWHA